MLGHGMPGYDWLAHVSSGYTRLVGVRSG